MCEENRIFRKNHDKLAVISAKCRKNTGNRPPAVKFCCPAQKAAADRERFAANFFYKIRWKYWIFTGYLL